MNSWLLKGGPLSVLRETTTPNSANILSRRCMTDVVEMESRMSTTTWHEYSSVTRRYFPFWRCPKSALTSAHGAAGSGDI